jgi:hypothetical protein
MPEDVGNSFWGHVAELTKRLKVVLYTFIIETIIMLVLPGNTDFLALTNNYQPSVSVFLRAVIDMVLPPNVKLIAL